MLISSTFLLVDLPPIDECSSKNEKIICPDFKREAVSLVLDQGYKASEVSGPFDLVENMLVRWAKQVKFEGNGGVPETGALT